MVLRCGESISFSFSGIRERIGIVGIQVDKCTSGQVDPLKYSQLRHKEYTTGQHTIQQLAAFTSCKEKQEENGLWYQRQHSKACDSGILVIPKPPNPIRETM